jgi:hypothetical protein
MWLYYFNKFIGGYTILFSVIIGIIRYHKILKEYRPFIYFLIVALFNEILSQFLTRIIGSNSINANIYILVEFLLILLLFSNWGFHTRKSVFYRIVGLVVLFVWILDNIVLHPLTQFNSIYRIVYSLVLIFLSIDEMNFIIVSERKNIIKNARFIICSAFIFYFSYKALLEAFFLVQPAFSNNFYYYLLVISAIINLLANLMYILAALWIPTRRRFLLPYQ